MAIEIKSRLKAAMNTDGGNPSAFVGLQQGVDSIGRLAPGIYVIAFSEDVDPRRAAYSAVSQASSRAVSVLQNDAQTAQITIVDTNNGVGIDAPFTLMVWELSPTE